MDKGKTNESYLEREKQDAREFLEVLKRIPSEDKGRALGMMEGFAIGVEKKNEAMRAR